MRIVFHSSAMLEVNTLQAIRYAGKLTTVKILTRKRATDPNFWEYGAKIVEKK